MEAILNNQNILLRKKTTSLKFHHTEVCLKHLSLYSFCIYYMTRPYYCLQSLSLKIKKQNQPFRKTNKKIVIRKVIGIQYYPTCICSRGERNENTSIFFHTESLPPKAHKSPRSARCKGGKGASLGRGKEIAMELKGDKRKNLELGRYMERLMETTH